MHTIISKRPTTFTYQQWELVAGNFKPIGSGVLINGGAGLVGGAELLSGRPMDERSKIIPDSVLTFVDDTALEYLMGVPKFKQDIDEGLIVVVKGKVSEDKANQIAKNDMLDDAHIDGRPYTKEDIEQAGGEMQSDGSVNIEHAEEDLAASKKVNAGAPSYVKKRNLEKKRRAKASEGK